MEGFSVVVPPVTPKEISSGSGTSDGELHDALVQFYSRRAAITPRHYQEADSLMHFEHTERSIADAKKLCELLKDSGLRASHGIAIECCTASLQRKHGKFDQASSVLCQALAGVQSKSLEAQLRQELATTYRHMDRLLEAKQQAELSYDLAVQCGYNTTRLEVLLTLASILYKDFQYIGEQLQLLKAIVILQSVHQRAQRQLRGLSADNEFTDSDGRDRRNLIRFCTYSLSRLSLCYDALKMTSQALKVARQAHEIALACKFLGVAAYSSFFYGRALLKSGRTESGRSQMNLPSGSYPLTPAMGFCTNPTDEGNMYLQELVDLGVDFHCVNEKGYTALDMAISSGNPMTTDIVRQGLRRNLQQSNQSHDIEATIRFYEREAEIRESYRVFFQDHLRRILRESSRRKQNFLADRNQPREGIDPDQLLSELQQLWSLGTPTPLRKQYLDVLNENPKLQKFFDPLHMIPYCAFVRQGEIRRSNPDCKALPYEPELEPTQYIIFISYARAKKGKARDDCPDDTENTIFQRIVAAVEEFLASHTFIDRHRLKLWLDYACVSPSNPEPGINALPIFVSQCDAFIGLVDDVYYTRAWCSVEVLMARTLAKAYGNLEWWEQVATGDAEDLDLEIVPTMDAWGYHSIALKNAERWTLRRGDVDMEITVHDKNLSFEEDRPRVAFLERQSMILG